MVLETKSSNSEKLDDSYPDEHDSEARGGRSESIPSLSFSQSDSPVDQLIDAIVYWSEKEFGISEFINARKEFDWQTGKVFDEDSFFPQRMTYFLEQFIFERPLSQSSEPSFSTPFEKVCNLDQSRQLHLTPLFKLIDSYDSHCHSVYEVKKVTKSILTILDLINNNKMLLHKSKSQSFEGLVRGDLFQGFVYTINGDYTLSNGILQHPRRVVKIIKKFLVRSKKHSDFHERALLTCLAKIHMRHLRHQHVDAKDIYLKLCEITKPTLV